MQRETLKGFLGDPLFHFLLTGCAIFGAYSWLDTKSGADDAAVIVVDNANLLRFMQYRSKSFDAPSAQQRLDATSGVQLNELIDEYVREEAMYRAALSFGLDSDDYVIRRRLVQKMDFMAEGVVRDGAEPTDVDLNDYYQSHAQRYQRPATVTFTHVFFSTGQRQGSVATELATTQLQRLNDERVSFAQAPKFGERFAFHLNYVERPLDEVTAHFGEVMGRALFALKPDAHTWVGPLQSPHGSHLVLLTAQQPSYVAELPQVRAQVLQDYRSEQAYRRRTNFAEDVVGKYRVETEAALSARQSL